ncbi:SDR family NAD(P)-dependent oxidoreductase [Kitasatospora sp. NPDC088160]|uniref:SDR family NAD(P)-dependent oxidoreductase n=1 Tax=Kitasatospora sp. NPDC088160 TaxID=3364072 RepID=UPI003823877A
MYGSGALAGRRLAVTGGSRGLGGEIVRAALDEGAVVVACARGGEDLAALAGEVGDAPLFTSVADVAQPGAVEEFVHFAVGAMGGIDGVVACAGGARGRGLDDATAEDWAWTWEVNAGHSARLLAAAVPHLRAAGGGSAVVISSISGWKPGPQAQYGAAKAAQLHLVSSLARELAPDGIRVNAVSPGSMLIEGKRWDRLRREEPGEFARLVAEVPGGRLVTPREVAEVVLFLLSDASSGMSGANVPVDRAQNAPGPQGY